jgi:hypothetical protein
MPTPWSALVNLDLLHLFSNGDQTATSGVNGIRGHLTCLACALKSHKLQIKLTGHTTCKTGAPEVTNGLPSVF